MHGVVELAEEIFHEPVRLGAPQGAFGLQDITDNPVHATGVGLLHYGFKQQNELQQAADAAEASGIMGRMKRWLQSNF